jgi:hypothetical protein
MRRFRFHLGTLVILVLLMGIGLAALRESTGLWDNSIFSITLSMLPISILLAVHSFGPRRAFWVGFALFGSAYLGLSIVPSIQFRLITTTGLVYLDSKVTRPIPRSVALYNLLVGNESQPDALFLNQSDGTFDDMPLVTGSKPWFSNILAGPPLAGSSGTSENFVRIGHSLLALMAAFVGGLISRYLYVRNRDSATM